MASATENRYINVYLNGKQVENTAKSLNAAYRQMSNELGKMTIGTEQYNRKLEELKKVKGMVDEHRKGILGIKGAVDDVTVSVDEMSSSWGRAKDIMMGVVGGNLIAGALNKIAGVIPGIIKQNADLSDSYADIRKTTGMSAEAVNELDQALRDMDTRTAQKELLDMAVVGGQIGLAEKDVLGFVNATDKLTVALGDEFSGGAEEVAKQMGTLRNVLTDMKTKDVEKDMLQLGNAINEISSKGFATGPVMTDIANRIGGVGRTFKMSSGQIMGTAAAFQELNISSEKGSTAFEKILKEMTVNYEGFAKVADMKAKDFKDLVNKDIFEAFIKVAEGSNKAGGQATEMGRILDYLGLKGSGASEVMAKLGANTVLLREKVDIASEALTGTSSIMDEFNIKNENAAAKLAKMGKEIQNFFTGATIRKWVDGFVDALYNMVKWVKENRDQILVFVKVLASMATAWATLRLITLLNVKAKYDWIKAELAGIAVSQKQIQALYGVGKAKALLIASGWKLIDVFNRLKAAFMSNPLGYLAAAAMGVYSAWKMLAGEGERLTKLQKEMLDIEKEHTANLAKEKAEVEIYFARLKQMNGATKERQKLIDEINGKYGITLKNLEDEAEFVKMLGEEYVKLTKSMAVKTDIKILTEQYEAARRELLKADENYQFQIDRAINRYVNTRDAGIRKSIEDVWDNFRNIRDEIASESDKILEKILTKESELQGLMKNNEEVEDDEATNENLKIDLEDKNNYRIEELIRLNERLSELNDEYLEKVEGHYDKEVASAVKKYRAIEKEADKNIRHLQELADKGNQKAISQIQKFDLAKKEAQELLAKELLEIEEKRFKEQERIFEEEQDKLEKWLEEEEIAEREFMKKITLEVMDEYEQRIEAVKDYYDKLLEEAERYGLADSELMARLQFEKLRKIQEIEDAQKKAREAQRAAEIQKYVETFLQYYDLMRDVVSQFNEFRRGREDKLLAQSERRYDAEISALTEALDKKMITQEEYDQKILENERQREHDEARIKKEAWLRERNARFTEALINTAVAVTRVLYNPILAAIVGASGAVQSAFIMAQPVPEFKKGGIVQGASHDQGGINMIDSKSGKKVGEMEGGEPYLILSNNTYRNNRAVVDALLKSSLQENGRSINFRSLIPAMPIMNYDALAMAAKYDRGGYYPPQPKIDSNTTGGMILDPMILAELKMLNAAFKKFPTSIRAKYVYKDVQEYTDDIHNAKERATFRQRPYPARKRRTA